MQVETYEQTEADLDGVAEAYSDEALALIEELGLGGQHKLVIQRAAGGDGDTVTERNVYRLMTQEEFNVYSICFPSCIALEGYDAGFVPVRVLQVAAHALRVIPNVELVVWYPRDSTIRDPLLLGRIREGYDTKHYILARWGEALDEFEFLKSIAKRKLTVSLAAQFKRFERELVAMKAESPEKIDQFLEGQVTVHSAFGYIGTPSMTA